ncbi:MAG: SGNH/GDSL hydrolase family protein [Bacteroidales bacterium]|nr:SGNH/GDSL hydrolase family protein [Bacteroidales bacterium]
MKKHCSYLTLLLLAGLLAMCSSKPAQSSSWVGTWGTAPQLVEPHNRPPEPGLTGHTLRQIFKVSIGGETVRMTFSNEYSEEPVTLEAVSIALSTGGFRTDAASACQLTFGGQTEVTMAPGATAVSDPVGFRLPPQAEVAVTIRFGQTSPMTVTGHPGSRTTSYLLTDSPSSDEDFASAVTTDHWYVLRGMDVLTAAPAASVAILGNSITDGRGSDTNRQNRWPDQLAAHLLSHEETSHVGVLNMGIGGNCVLRERGGLGPSGEARFASDILAQAGVKWLIICEGVNDLCTSPDARQTAERLKEVFRDMAGRAHAQGLKVYAATVMPFKNHYYFTSDHEAGRQILNEWIRQADCFDAVIDFDALVRDPSDPEVMQAACQSDYLHLNPAGYALMGTSIDYRLFMQ